jgi:flagellar motility protein MotE (MotC chaperone)
MRVPGAEAGGRLGQLLRAVRILPSARHWSRSLGARRGAAFDRAGPAARVWPTFATGRQWPRLSLPLVTALVAGLAAGLSIIDALRGDPSATDSTETFAVAPTSILGAAPLLERDIAVPEPAAGPETDATPAVEGERAASGRRPGGRRALPEIPEVPTELDDIARELQRRRTEVLELEAALALREAAVRAAEADLKAQVDRLETFRRDLEALVGEAETEEEERLQQLVRMYESMRAKSAAAIFDRLELPVILAVAKRMREARMAAILAAMDPARARLVTSELARERQLPRLD